MAVKQKSGDELTDAIDRLRDHRARYQSPTGLRFSKVSDFMRKTMSVLFPQFSIDDHADVNLDDQVVDLVQILSGLIQKAMSDLSEAETDALARDFVTQLPAIAESCHLDAEALIEGDPAAESLEEVIVSYPGFYAIVVYRVANALLKQEIPMLPRVLTELAHQRTGIDIHPGATIGKSFFIDHGTGVVIGGTAVIGNNVKIYQGVTLGALRVDRAAKSTKRHPTIEDNVVIYASATILGGNTIVGQNSVIGGNVWLTKSVPAWSRVMFKACDTEEVIPMQPKNS
ncbi:serine O-acetyltransferase EpsC [Kordiimonas sp. SCSIO 12610]|uniref:serine O-acetyltransferase EpsC n=1 Tax=Kordiimonas sp. SCSIO 12610 TaxID=2829597 RepID=UPI00210CA9AE|nr:serine O-acetyltransferase EpsC [Kordiimonas sp. SCSIO 12610]UTW55380.1 serine acetyltransferase [Kordiimonas sp. SCSIO 12610]